MAREWSVVGYVLLALILAGIAHVQSAGSAAELDTTRAFPHPMVLEASLDRCAIESREPVIARITLTNRGREPVKIRARVDGAPYIASVMVAGQDGSFRRHSLWLRRVPPSQREIVVEPGESTAGELPLLLGYSSGFVFPAPGHYLIKFQWSPGKGPSPIESRVIEVNARPQTAANAVFWNELEAIAYHHDGYDPKLIDRIPQEERLAGVRLLARMISRDKPDLIDPDNRPEDRKKADLVDSLARLLEQYPNTYYSGYVARYLGLVYFKTFEHYASKAQHQDRGLGAASESSKELRPIANAGYRRALRYLTIAEDADVWPRGSATFWLGCTHVMAQEWPKAEACCRTLRTRYDSSNGAALADELTAAMKKFKAKVQRHWPTQNNESPK